MGVGVNRRRRAIEFLRDGFLGRPEKRYTINDYIEWVKIAGQNYALTGGPFGGPQLGAKQEPIDQSLGAYIDRVFKANPIVFGCMEARRSLFAEAQLKFRNKTKGNLFTTDALSPLQEPWPGGSMSDLLDHMIQDADLFGNWFGVRRGKRIMRLYPEWVEIMLGYNSKADAGHGDIDLIPLGYIYYPGGKNSGADPIPLDAGFVAHFAPIPDPKWDFRGMSWLTPILRDVMADQAGTTHKLQYLEGGAVPNMIVKADAKYQLDAFEKFKELFLESRAEDPFGPLFLGGGADAQVVGTDMQKVDFKTIQALGENRICVAARVPAIIAGASEGLEAATYSNFASARRAFADGTMRRLWGKACEALENIVQMPGGARLDFDDAQISYLQDDEKDQAEVMKEKASAAKMFFEAGYEMDSVTNALYANDISLLSHTGMKSVQNQPSGSSNGSNNGNEPADSPALQSGG